jgi:hypothetical protein
MGNGDFAVKGAERPAKNTGGIALHYYHIESLWLNNLLKFSQNCGSYARKALIGLHYFEKMVGNNAEMFKHFLGKFFMLPGMNNFQVDPAAVAFKNHRSQLDYFWPGAENKQQSSHEN